MVSFGTMFLPEDGDMEAILTALAQLDPIKAIVKAAPSTLGASCKDIVNNATNIVLVPWLPQASFLGHPHLHPL